MRKPLSIRTLWLATLIALSGRATLWAQQVVDVHLHLNEATTHPSANSKTHAAPAVVWLNPLGERALPFPPHNRYILLQKNRMFSPHLLIVPVGSVVVFPNADPFFHNVFSLFDGKRFDLGLYEAGSSKEVTFSREGLSYIFCNIHPEMSAVVLSLSTPLYAIADPQRAFHLHDVPPGDYDLHLWVEGEAQPLLDHLTHRVHIGATRTDLGEIIVPATSRPATHENKFGQPYDRDSGSIY